MPAKHSVLSVHVGTITKPSEGFVLPKNRHRFVNSAWGLIPQFVIAFPEYHKCFTSVIIFWRSCGNQLQALSCSLFVVSCAVWLSSPSPSRPNPKRLSLNPQLVTEAVSAVPSSWTEEFRLESTSIYPGGKNVFECLMRSMSRGLKNHTFYKDSIRSHWADCFILYVFNVSVV